MSLRCQTPCDFGECPYNAMYSRDCEYWCGSDEPDDYPDAEFYSGEDMELFESEVFCDN